jgi:hypothetical protein
MSVHPLAWQSPQPLWSRFGAEPGVTATAPGQARPAILRFANDEFMDQLLGLLETDPGALTQHVARHETWRSPAGAHATEDLVERVPLPAPLKRSRLMTRLARVPKPAPTPAPSPRLKLYQPAHQRFYVAAATLACAIPGLPDRKLAGGHEQIGFVLRRLMPANKDAPPGSPLHEYGFVKDAAGASWQRVAEGAENVLVPGEERLPAFPLGHQDGNGIKRSMWGGLIPVGRREQYLSASVTRTAKRLVEGQAEALKPAVPPQPKPSKLARTTEFKIDFAEPWKAMIQSAMKAAADIKADGDEFGSGDKRQRRIRAANLGYQSQSWLLLLDLMAFLDRHLGTIAYAIRHKTSAGLTGDKLKLYDWLSAEMTVADRDRLANGFAGGGVGNGGRPDHLLSIAEALRQVDKPGVGAQLEAVETQYRDVPGAERAKWPGFHYLLAGVVGNGSGGAIDCAGSFRALPPANVGPAPDDEIALLASALSSPPAPGPVPPVPTPFDINLVDKLTVLVARALDGGDESAARELPFAQQLAHAMAETVGDTGQFRLRFVHLNADCGPVHPPTLSEPSVPFELASFFDSDAPARPVRISLPMDTSPAGLRKHARGTAFVLSDMLCGQVQRAKGMGFIDLVLQVLPWPLHKDIDTGDGGGCKNGNSIDIGMICSLSIPIVTLCALILLMIIVGLLDFIFRWLPFLVFCFPVPKLKGKPAPGGGG